MRFDATGLCAVSFVLCAACETGGGAAGGAAPRALQVSADAGGGGAGGAGGEPSGPYTTNAAPVEIVYDRFEIPHVYAANEADVFHGAGYAQAVDRLFALEMGRRAARGTLAEVLGEAGFTGDLQARTFEFARLAEESLRALAAESPADHRTLEAFASGINRRLAEIARGDAPMPPELVALGVVPADFTAGDLMSAGLRMLFGFSNTLEYDLLYTLLQRLVADADALPIFQPVTPLAIMAQGDPGAPKARTPGHPATTARPGPAPLPQAEVRRLLAAIERFRTDLGVGEGSNGLLVGGAATDTGRPYLLNDSHARLADPNLMFWSHLNTAEAGGALDVVGVGFTGVPGVHVGHNRHLAWGATTNFADMTDLFSVSVAGDTADLGGTPAPVSRRTETIRVRTPEGGVETREVTLETIPGVGVFLPDALLPVPPALVAQGRLLLAWSGAHPTTEYRMYLDFDRAGSLDAFEAAVRRQRSGMQNWMAASAEGIRYVTHGEIPDRGPPAGRPRANAVLDAAVPGNLWTGAFLSADRLPRLDGTQPFIATANNDPWGHTLDNDPLNDAFYYGSFYAPGFRAARLTEWAEAATTPGAPPVGRDALERLQMEVHSTLAARVLPLLAEAVARIGAAPELAEFAGRAELVAAAGRLAAWDREMRTDSQDAALFRVFFAMVSRHLLADDLTLLFDAIDEAQPVALARVVVHVLEQRLDVFLDGPRDVALVGALADAVTELSARGAPTWGELHHGLFRRPDGTNVPLPVPGDDSTLNVSQCHFWREGTLQPVCETTAGAVYRMITGFADDGTPETTFNVPMGNDRDTRAWLEGIYSPLPFRRAEVEAAAVRRVTLPAGG